MISEILNTKWYTIIDKNKTPDGKTIYYNEGYHNFKKPQVERKLTFLDIVDKLCGIYLYFYSMGKLGKKLESKNVNWTYKKNLKLK
jgi:hypothetical protein